MLLVSPTFAHEKIFLNYLLDFFLLSFLLLVPNVNTGPTFLVIYFLANLLNLFLVKPAYDTQETFLCLSKNFGIGRAFLQCFSVSKCNVSNPVIK